MTFPAQAMQILVELQVGEDAAWVDVTEDLRMSSGVNITRGRQDEASEVNPGQCVIVLNNRHGKYSEFNPLGPYYGRLTKNTPIRVSVAPFGDGVYYRRFVGEVSKWPPRWDVSDTDVWVPIEAAGILRRIRANTQKAVSAHRRFVQNSAPFAYWPMTDGEDSIEASPVFGVSKLRAISEDGVLFANQPQWGKGELGFWLEPVVLFPQEHHMVGSLPITPADTEWSFEWVQSGFAPSTVSGFIIWTGENEDTRTFEVLVEIQPESPVSDGLSVRDTGTAFVEPPMVDGNITNLRDGGPHLFRVTLIPDGAVYTAFLYMDGKLIDSGATIEAISLVAPTGIRYLSAATSPESPVPDNKLSVGHVVFYGPNPPDPMDTYKAMRGYPNEPAGRRIERLCEEQGIQLDVVGDLDLTQPCGPQEIQQFSELTQSAADVDGGTLGESTEDLALLYRTQRSRYNQGEVL